MIVFRERLMALSGPPSVCERNVSSFWHASARRDELAGVAASFVPLDVAAFVSRHESRGVAAAVVDL
jgi:hypothetical protein